MFLKFNKNKQSNFYDLDKTLSRAIKCPFFKSRVLAAIVGSRLDPREYSKNPAISVLIIKNYPTSFSSIMNNE